ALVGAKKEVLNAAILKIKEKYEGIQIVYSSDGYFTEFAPIIENVVKSGAKFCLCAMGSPKQEYFISELKKRAKGIVMIGVGGTFDVLSGNVKAAPLIYKKLGLEWLYRTIKQPERLKRIFPALPIFFFQSIIDSMKEQEDS
ncbi:MAG: WecB/TagA/CpsF family glycosyltransferase, partial [Candidatus Gastranaerophilales bacterium]|nr:WecB/TagA/CpsF family glycosyltransferase [Candidatus Gastranaerophilales bacterium]